LIKALQAAIDKHGDLPVAVSGRITSHEYRPLTDQTIDPMMIEPAISSELKAAKIFCL
jgi:hypothetical protein